MAEKNLENKAECLILDICGHRRHLLAQKIIAGETTGKICTPENCSYLEYITEEDRKIHERIYI